MSKIMRPEDESCFFCSPDPERVFYENELVIGLWDGFPVSDGHALLVPRRHVATWFDATDEERQGLMRAIDLARAEIEKQYRPDGYNIGINVGEAAGQTVFHLHLHVIPRYHGDVPDPSGGVRLVIPSKGNYRAVREPALARGGHKDPFASHLRPLFARSRDIAIVAAFVQNSGLEELASSIDQALQRGAHIRVLTGDYLNITQVEALQRLLDWASASAAGMDGEDPESGELGERPLTPGNFEARVIETARIEASTFHPKSWRFEGDNLATAFVGSSNLSRAALRSGIEWNLRVDRHRDHVAYHEVVAAFEELWQQARQLDQPWLRSYRERARRAAHPLPPGEELAEPLAEPHTPHQLQTEALAALAQTRDEGRSRALVVMATGLGKTYLAALDVQQVEAELGRWPRVLFLAHRGEILSQAATTFRSLFRTAEFGWFIGSSSELQADVVYASVQKLSRPEHLAQLRDHRFDYVVVDEAHHAAASSYRRILAHLEPGFVLGLTATPDRADAADILALLDDNEPYRADLVEGISHGLLVPFRYFGLEDTVDYKPIPWRNGRFDPETLAAAVQSQARMEKMWSSWQKNPASCTLVFCCTIAHARFVTDWLRGQGVRVECVHSGNDSYDRREGLEQLKRGELDALCTVDLFNEGLDARTIDRVVMLRPTESPVIFLQQLGRGLRLSDAKQDLLVIDFVGNHKVFLQRLRTLLSLGSSERSLQDFIAQGGSLESPEFNVLLEPVAVDLLRRLMPSSTRNDTVRLYRELRDTRSRRPSAGELYRMGRNPKSLKHPAGWFGFVQDEGDLGQGEQQARSAGEPWFVELEKSAMDKCFKMVVVQVLAEQDALGIGMALDELAQRCHHVLKRSPELFVDIEKVKALPDPHDPGPDDWLSYWNKNPVHFWSRGRFFDVQGDRFVARLALPQQAEAAEAFKAMTLELVDLRLAEYRRRRREQASGEAFEAKVLWNQRDPILKLPSQVSRPDIARGERDVRLPDGSVWQFRFAKEFCNVARPVGTQRNQLPDLMRRWFGLAAGHPGTNFSVGFAPSPDGWWIEPLGAKVISLSERGRVVAFPDLRAAAGTSSTALHGSPEAEQVKLPISGLDQTLFAVRASGDSMDGGSQPIRDGDWLVLKWARDASLDSVLGRVVMVGIGDPREQVSYHIKRVVRSGDAFALRSDNPAVPPMPADQQTVVYALSKQVIKPEELAPTEGCLVPDEQLAELFGLSAAPSREVSRVDGHLFFLIEEATRFQAPDRLDLRLPDRRPGETAFVLLRLEPGIWRYCGVARWDGQLWAMPALSYSVWKGLVGGRRSSRTLEPEWEERARSLIDQLLVERGVGSWLENAGKRCRIEGRSPQGGMKISGGPDGFAERTVSPTDVGWVLKAMDRVESLGGVLDEATVNRLRYIEGTPNRATRWIDTGWAIVLARSGH